MFQNVILTQQVSSEACRYLSQYIHIGRIFYLLAYTNNIIINFWIIEYKVFFLHYLSGRMMCGRADNRRATCPITLPRHFSGKTLYVAVPGQEQITRTITSWLHSKFHKRIFLTHSSSLIFECIAYSSSPSLWGTRLEGGGGERLADQVDQLTLECCHSFRFYGSCWKWIPIRDSSMPKRILSQCGASSDVFIGLIVPTTCSFICWD